MASKKCCVCKLKKPLDTFNKDNARKDGLQTKCRDCCSLQKKQHYLNNKSSYRGRATIAKKKVKNEIQQLKENTPCMDCGVKYPFYVMQFDHIGEKRFLLSSAHMHFGREIIQEEIANCEIVCANCHAARTYTRAHKKES